MCYVNGIRRVTGKGIMDYGCKEGMWMWTGNSEADSALHSTDIDLKIQRMSRSTAWLIHHMQIYFRLQVPVVINTSYFILRYKQVQIQTGPEKQYQYQQVRTEDKVTITSYKQNCTDYWLCDCWLH